MFGDFILQIKYFGRHIFSKISFEKEYNGGWYMFMLMFMLTCIQLFANLWTVAHQAPLSMGILQARILEWVAMHSSRDICLGKYKTREALWFLLLWKVSRKKGAYE